MKTNNPQLIFPTPEFVQQANIRDGHLYKLAQNDLDKYWGDWADQLVWQKRWNKVRQGKGSGTSWFEGGEINASVNCLEQQPREALAVIWEGEDGSQKVYTYGELLNQVEMCSSGLREFGVKKGDRVVLYLPMIPELMIACLACARIGAVHSVVFGGFSGAALKDRVVELGSKVIITAGFGWRRGKRVELGWNVRLVIEAMEAVEFVIEVRSGNKVKLTGGKSKVKWLKWEEWLRNSRNGGRPSNTQANDPLFVLYTSGTTGKPKGIIHGTGGYLTGVLSTSKMVLDLKPGDRYWCTADIGWITGHSYVIYGPLMAGATVVMYEGAPDWPEPDRWWKIIDRHKVNVFYTSPTAVRGSMAQGDHYPRKHNLGSLRLLGSVGEPINPSAWWWYFKNIGGSRCPVVDTWWQTETGSIMVSTLPGVDYMIPGLAGKPLPGIKAEVVNTKGGIIRVGSGLMAVRESWPSMMKGVYGNDQQYIKQCWQKWRTGFYFAGDSARKNKEGYYQFLGRVDEVLNIAGHRLGTAEIENVVVGHSDVAEAAAIGMPDKIKGEALVVFAVLKDNKDVGRMRDEIENLIIEKIGKVSRPKVVYVVNRLPKTRSGKIMRRLLRSWLMGLRQGDTSTLAEPDVWEELEKLNEKEIIR